MSASRKPRTPEEIYADIREVDRRADYGCRSIACEYRRVASRRPLPSSSSAPAGTEVAS